MQQIFLLALTLFTGSCDISDYPTPISIYAIESRAEAIL